MRPSAPAVTFNGKTLDYRALSDQIEVMAWDLVHDFRIAPGDRIAYLGANSTEMLVLLLAASRLGALFLPLNWRLALPEQLYILEHAAPALIVIEPEFTDRVDAFKAACPAASVISFGGCPAGRGPATAVPRAKDALADYWRLREPPGPHLPCLLVYTSGTTGRPKGAVLTQSALIWNAMASWHMHGLTAADHILTVLPLFHVGGLNIQTVPALLAGAHVTLHARFDPAATLTAIARDKPTLTVLVPATLEALRAHPDFAATDFSSLRVITTGSTIVPEDIITAYAARQVRVIQVYGATETGPIVIYERFDQPRTKPGSTGVAGLNTSACILDDTGAVLPAGAAGEIAVLGPNILSGYWRDADATREAFRDGWYLTGDIGVMDADGHFTVRERKKNVIISGGENIYPAEVERVIATFPGIADCAVVGRPDPRWQEVPIAAVVLKPGATLDRAGLDNHLAENLARFKVPRAIVVRDSLPKTALGKVQHFALKKELDGV